MARQLLAFAERYGREKGQGEVEIPISLTQGDIADLVGASRKRVNQAMTLFRQQGLIALYEKGRIMIIERAGLANYCD